MPSWLKLGAQASQTFEASQLGVKSRDDHVTLHAL